MDRLKFRVWNDSDMYYCKIGVQLSKIEQNLATFVHGKKMLCTELKDKNNRLIYEGDVIKVGAQIYSVTWNDEGAFSLKNSTWKESEDIYLAAEGKVLGNIHENPELL
ncbi:MAG: hypothetical protein GY718_09480 [Lentisphaerae bacterium]|nr:hypothetical protein [Lentisphaerota bacterium]